MMQRTVKNGIIMCLFLVFFVAILSVATASKNVTRNGSAIQLLLLSDSDTPAQPSTGLPPVYIHLAGKGNTNVSGSGKGSEYWVDKNNLGASDSGPGTESLPWRTFKHAVETVVAGDTVNVMPGVYEDTEPQNTGGSWKSFAPANNGEPGNPITYRSVIPRTAILKSSATGTTIATRDKALGFYSRHDIIFDGFKTIGMVHFLSSQRVDFINGEVTMGSIVWDDPSLLWGIAVEASNNCIIRNNFVHSMAYAEKNGSKYVSHNQAGIMVFGGSNSVSENNLIEYNELDMNANVYSGLGNKGGNLIGNVWRNNFIKNATAGLFSIGSTSGIYSTNNSRYSNNVIVDCKYGIEFDNNTLDAVVNNNTFVNSAKAGFKVVMLNSTNITFVNNIISKTQTVIYADGYTGTLVDYFLDIFGNANYNQYDQYSDAFACKESSPRIELTFAEYQEKGHDADGTVANPNFVDAIGTVAEDFKRTSYPGDGAGGTYPAVRGAFTSNSAIVGNY